APPAGAAQCPSQLARRIAHLESDVAQLRQRKQQLEGENEALAAELERPDLQ
ncbi:unnamed protein product, partial [Prorocentrum cordatum]